MIEDQFAEVEMTDDDVDPIDVVGDLIRHIQSVGMRGDNAASSKRSSDPQVLPAALSPHRSGTHQAAAE